MHFLNSYGLATGSKIDKPYLYTTFFPLPIEKFITFQAQSKYDSKDYNFYQDVIDIINPILSKHGISIIQIGGEKEKHYQRVINLLGKTSVNQLGYIIERSMLHFGPDSFGVHIASMYDKPIVGLYSIIQSEAAGPFWGDKNKHILFDSYKRVKNGKPSYSPKENPKSINTVKPEEIANAIFKLLNIDSKSPFETIYTGPKYSNEIIRELIPNFFNKINSPEIPIEIRLDLDYDEKSLLSHLQYLKKAILVTDKNIDLEIIKRYKPNIMLLVYKIKENDDPNFVKSVISLGVKVLLISELDIENINSKKINYYDIGVINRVLPVNTTLINKIKEKDIDKLYFKSNKFILSKNNFYSSRASEQQNLNISFDFEYQKVIDNELFWKDLDFYTIIKKLD